ncbi:MAG: MBL fold metallo-hydrolase, partial [Hyphomicrobiales bacterium]
MGQGDGAVLFTPERDANERVILIDAGEGDEMHRFLAGRFKGVQTRFQFHAAVLTHPDQDHYAGFESIFNDPRFGFGTVYHSGVVERPEGTQFEKLGGKVKDPATGIEYLGQLAESNEEMLQLFGDPDALGRGRYPRVINAAIRNNDVLNFAMLSTAHGQSENGRSYLPGFAPSNARGYSIEVIAPVVEPDAAGQARLRVSGDYGETKNGHSVVLRLVFGAFSVLFGGDLNARAERLLLAKYGDRPDLIGTKGGLDALPAAAAERQQMVAKARARLQSDVMKVCHHGATDVTDEFLDAVKPASFVISSGDNEGHVHPRPDLLGRLGRMGRGASPVILSTELQRSTRATEDEKLVKALNQQIETYRLSGSAADKAAVDASIALLARDNVDVYGAIYLKTDGQQRDGSVDGSLVGRAAAQAVGF